MDRRRDRLHVEVRRGSFEGVQKVFGISRRDRIKQDQDPIDVRRNLLEQLQPLADERRLHRNETGDVTARLGEARNEAATDRVDGLSKHDGDCACLLHQRRRGGRALRKNEFGLQRDEFLGVSLSQLRIAWWRPAIVDPDVAILRPSQLLKPLAERCDEGSSAYGISTPMRRTRSCERAASGMAAVPPRATIKSRRLMSVLSLGRGIVAQIGVLEECRWSPLLVRHCRAECQGQRPLCWLAPRKQTVRSRPEADKPLMSTRPQALSASVGRISPVMMPFQLSSRRRAIPCRNARSASSSRRKRRITLAMTTSAARLAPSSHFTATP